VQVVQGTRAQELKGPVLSCDHFLSSLIKSSSFNSMCTLKLFFIGRYTCGPFPRDPSQKGRCFSESYCTKVNQGLYLNGIFTRICTALFVSPSCQLWHKSIFDCEIFHVLFVFFCYVLSILSVLSSLCIYRPNLMQSISGWDDFKISFGMSVCVFVCLSVWESPVSANLKQFRPNLVCRLRA
jgi:hypothetical protein